ncbi:hypothetical protein PINS_up000726 [Pythium insidiosum]|nr:hypothetical protein PINS_up000726 [Pythium insidiosum]
MAAPRDDRWPAYSSASNGGSNNNNNEDDDDFVIVEDQLRGRQLAGATPTLHQGPPRNATKADQHPPGRRGRFVQPPSHRFPADLEQFVGDPEESEEPCTRGPTQFDRPPSRQRHAFPTNLLDPREFMSPKQHTDAAISITPWHVDDEDDTSPNSVEETQTKSKTDEATEAPYASARPPSRYMTKAKRPSAHSAPSNPPAIEQSPVGEPGGRLPSRRGLGSWNQTHHDPKMDGFADVDESVPPPFRIEITTGSYHSQYIPAAKSRVLDDDRDDAHVSGPQRRWSSFGNMSQLRQQMQDIGAPSFVSPRPTIEAASRVSHPIERNSPWLSSVDEPAVQSNPADSSPRTASGREPRTPPVEYNNNNNNQSTHQWFHAPPQASCTSRFEDMDAETAIANTPLFESDDLMAITQLSDLRLDDFLADATMPITNSATLGQPKPLSTGSTLKTSLGQDFLSLFAQH